MIKIARRSVSDVELMEALMPGSAGGDVAPRPLGQLTAISIKGLTPGVAYDLAACCHPIPGDRIVGLRREDEGIEVHVIGCGQVVAGSTRLLTGPGATLGCGTARLTGILRDAPVRLAKWRASWRQAPIRQLVLRPPRRQLHTFHVDVESTTSPYPQLIARRAADGSARSSDFAFASAPALRMVRRRGQYYSVIDRRWSVIGAI